MKKLLIVLVLLFIIPVQNVYAARQDAQNIILDISNIPDNASYIDILTNIEDEKYTDFDKEYMRAYSFDAKELSQYDKNGLVSYSCHYKDKGVKADISIKEGKITFTDHKTTVGFFKNHNELKIAVLNKNGQIIQVSDTIKINDNDHKIYLAGDIKYNVGENEIDPDMFDNRFLKVTSDNWPVFIAVDVTLAGLVITLIVLVVKRHIQSGKQADKSPSNRVAKNILSVCILIGILAIAASIAAFLFFPL